MNLKGRVQRLEGALSIERAPPVIFVSFVPGARDQEVQRIEYGAQQWRRRTGESEGQMKQRALAEAHTLPGRARVFLCHCTE